MEHLAVSSGYKYNIAAVQSLQAVFISDNAAKHKPGKEISSPLLLYVQARQ